ncbi:MAG: chemotaxis protein CheW [Rhodocyclaceae bacterium]
MASQQLVKSPAAREPATVAAPRQYLTFSLGQELFAMPIAPIREIIEFNGLTQIPLTPDFLRGVINLRGAVVPVIDLSVRFGRAETQIGRRTCVVIVEVALDEGLYPLGVIVNSVSEVLDVEPGSIESRPGFGAGLRSDFVGGMLNINSRFVVVLDMNSVLSVGELEQLVGAAQASAMRAGLN